MKSKILLCLKQYNKKLLLRSMFSPKISLKKVLKPPKNSNQNSINKSSNIKTHLNNKNQITKKK